MQLQKAVRAYAKTLADYYRSRGLSVSKEELKETIKRKLKAIELIALGGSPGKEVIAIRLSTFEERLNPKYGIKVLEERPHTVYMNRKTGKAKCTCQWFSKHKVCKHVVKALLLKEKGPSYLRRKLNFPAYKENRKKKSLRREAGASL